MSNATTHTTTTAATAKAQAIFCQPPTAPDNAQLAAATPTDITPAQPVFTQEDADLLNTLIQQAGQAEQLTATTEGVAGAGVSQMSEVARARVAKCVIKRAKGATWLDLSEQGDQFAVIRALCYGSKPMYKLILQGDEAYREHLAQELEAKLARRAARPKRKYVIGRIGKDQDGILKHPDTGELLEVEPDNGKLLEFALEKVHPAYKQTANEQDKGAGGRPIVYNIAFIGGPASAVAIPRAQDAIEASFSDADGGNQAVKSPFG